MSLFSMNFGKEEFGFPYFSNEVIFSRITVGTAKESASFEPALGYKLRRLKDEFWRKSLGYLSDYFRLKAAAVVRLGSPKEEGVANDDCDCCGDDDCYAAVLGEKEDEKKSS